jgi:hypothetical protein
MQSPQPDTPSALYKVGDKLVLAAPAHTGLPNGAAAMVISLHPFERASGWCYGVTLMGCGADGSGIQFVKSVRETWLRTEGRIATAKSCAAMSFGAFMRLAPQMVVPLFQRRYCWGEPHWRQLWRDIVSPRHLVSASNPHAIGRVVIARELGGTGANRREALVLIDGQQRMTTLMLLLCAVRDVARRVDAQAAAPLLSAINHVLLSRTRTTRLQHGAAATALATPLGSGGGGAPNGAQSGAAAASRHELMSSTIEQAKIGLESLAGAETVRLIPTRDDRLPFCSIVLSAPFDRAASEGARKMSACYDFYTAQLLAWMRHDGLEATDEDTMSQTARSHTLAGAAQDAMHGETAACIDGGLPHPKLAHLGCENQSPTHLSCEIQSPAHRDCEIQSPAHPKLALLDRLLESSLQKLSLVVFELQDGVALQNMYDLLAQRELTLSHFFAETGGQAMRQSDLVRNLLLGHIADEDERLQAYDDCWRPVEQANDDGDAQSLDGFLTAFLHSKLPEPEGKGSVAKGTAPAGVSTALLEGFGALVRAHGGTAGAIRLQAVGTVAANAPVVDSDAARCAALDLLNQLRDAATRTCSGH